MNENTEYSYLPEALIEKVLEGISETKEEIKALDNIDESEIKRAEEILRQKNLINKTKTESLTTSIVAVDGMSIIEELTRFDLILCTAIGIGGLNEREQIEWPEQFLQYQGILNHSEANQRLASGIMHMLELKVLSTSNHDLKIIDGTHFTSLIKLNSMLSAREDDAPTEYLVKLRKFMETRFNSIIPDMPEIVEESISNPKIIAMPKSSSSTDVIDSKLIDLELNTTDRVLFSKILKPGEYLTPLSVGQSKQERDSIWNDLHIRCNLNIATIDSKFSDKKLES